MFEQHEIGEGLEHGHLDPLAAAASGLPVAALEYLFLGLIALTIVITHASGVTVAIQRSRAAVPRGLGHCPVRA